jgi:hypothetical protein
MLTFNTWCVIMLFYDILSIWVITTFGSSMGGSRSSGSSFLIY